MEVLLYLIPVALAMGGVGLAAFLWAMRSGQFDDLDGAAHRILFDDDSQPDPRDPDPAPSSDGTPQAGDPRQSASQPAASPAQTGDPHGPVSKETRTEGA